MKRVESNPLAELWGTAVRTRTRMAPRTCDATDPLTITVPTERPLRHLTYAVAVGLSRNGTAAVGNESVGKDDYRKEVAMGKDHLALLRSVS